MVGTGKEMEMHNLTFRNTCVCEVKPHAMHWSPAFLLGISDVGGGRLWLFSPPALCLGLLCDTGQITQFLRSPKMEMEHLPRGVVQRTKQDAQCGTPHIVSAQ